MKKGHILALHMGTRETSALLIDTLGQVVDRVSKPHRFIYPHHGWIEQDPLELWDIQYAIMQEILNKGFGGPSDVRGIALTTAPSTVVVWDPKTSKPLWNAILWNDRRPVPPLSSITSLPTTGLIPSSTFSAYKMRWILEKVQPSNPVICGTLNSWLLWKLSGHKALYTDATNASKTLLYNLETEEYDPELLEAFNIPLDSLPPIQSNAEIYGTTDLDLFQTPVPIASMIASPQGALFGHAPLATRQVHLTLGTGTVMLAPQGPSLPSSRPGLLITPSCQLPSQAPHYAYEALTYSVGSTTEWLKDSMGLIKTPREIEGLAYSVPDSGGVYFIPALEGLGTPYWDDHVRGTLFGLSSSTHIGHFMRALTEGIAHQIADSLSPLAPLTKAPILCSGSESKNLALLQYIADLLQRPLKRTEDQDMAPIGAAQLAGLALNLWDLPTLKSHKRLIEQEFQPEQSEKDIQAMRQTWETLRKQAQKATTTLT